MGFCPSCGHPLPHMPPVRCASCGRELWRNPKPAAAALVTHDGSLLLVQRAIAPWRGRWCAPSGFCDWEEHPIATAERETFEETGIRVEVTGYLGTWMSTYAEDDAVGGAGDDAPSIGVGYYHARPRGEPAGEHDPAEVADTAWFPVDELPAELAPPTVFPHILTAWRAAYDAGRTATPLPDRPV